MNHTLAPHPEPPDLWHSLSEGARALFEIQQLYLSSPLLRRAPQGDGHPVMTLPGFGNKFGGRVILFPAAPVYPNQETGDTR